MSPIELGLMIKMRRYSDIFVKRYPLNVKRRNLIDLPAAHHSFFG